MRSTLPNPYYYLDNFSTVLRWVDQRYHDLLLDSERGFIADFFTQPKAARALLARMVMRKGNLFRGSKLRYEEIGDAALAARALVKQGWVDDNPLITLDELFALLTRPELAVCLAPALKKTNSDRLKKNQQLANLRSYFPEPRSFAQWHMSSVSNTGLDANLHSLSKVGIATNPHPNPGEQIYHLLVTEACNRIRLMFFGNLRQDWSEFVLSDLGLYTYEKVNFTDSSRAFHTRQDVDSYLHLYQCRERFESAVQVVPEPPPSVPDPSRESMDDILADIPMHSFENSWLETRRAKLLFQVARYYEQRQEWDQALRWYRDCRHPEARARTVRVLERNGCVAAAHQMACAAIQIPDNDVELQQLIRALPRLARKLKLPARAASPAATRTVINLKLDAPVWPLSVETCARDHLSLDHAPVYYVENTLINALFGLLCWDVIFTALPGAFFHPFQRAPVDLHSPDFYARRKHEFGACLSQLDSDQYRHSIVRTFEEKSGVQCAFVAWDALSRDLLDHALTCIPALHLKKFFERIFLNVRVNRSGLPDLIQFWPDEKRYCLIEVKGPGDRLQDNQIRWLDYFLAQGIPASVCHVQWSGESD